MYYPSIPDSLEVTVDTREQQALPIPKSIVWEPEYRWPTRRILTPKKKKKIGAGDYMLTAFPHAARLERKGTARELFTNFCTKDWARQERAFEKLADCCLWPILLIEENIGEIFRQAESLGFDSDVLQDRLSLVSTRWGIPIMWCGHGYGQRGRDYVATYATHLLVSHAYQYLKKGFEIDEKPVHDAD